MIKYKCIACSTDDETVFITPKEVDGCLYCPLCNSNEIEEI